MNAILCFDRYECMLDWVLTGFPKMMKHVGLESRISLSASSSMSLSTKGMVVDIVRRGSTVKQRAELFIYMY